MRVLFVIQAHVTSTQLIEQIRVMLSCGHFVILSLDTASIDARIHELSASSNNFRLLNSIAVSWCGLSIVNAFMNSLYVANDVKGWNY